MWFEYGVAFRGNLHDVHRDGMNEEEAREWIADWVDLSGAPDAMTLIRRPVGRWEPVKD